MWSKTSAFKKPRIGFQKREFTPASCICRKCFGDYACNGRWPTTARTKGVQYRGRRILAAHFETHCGIYTSYYRAQSPYQETKQLPRKYPKKGACDKTAAINYLVWFATMGGTLFAWVIPNLSVWLLENEEELTLHSNLWDDKWQKEKKREIICLHAEHIWTRHMERFLTLHNRNINCSSTWQIYWSETLLNALNDSGSKY